MYECLKLMNLCTFCCTQKPNAFFPGQNIDFADFKCIFVFNYKIHNKFYKNRKRKTNNYLNDEIYAVCECKWLILSVGLRFDWLNVVLIKVAVNFDELASGFSFNHFNWVVFLSFFSFHRLCAALYLKCQRWPVTNCGSARCRKWSNRTPSNE